MKKKKRLPVYPAFYDALYICNLDNAKFIADCYDELPKYYNLYYPRWPKALGPHGMIFNYMLKNKKLDLVHYYMYHNIDFIKSNQITHKQYRHLLNKINLPEKYKDGYLHFYNVIYPIRWYLPVPHQFLDNIL